MMIFLLNGEGFSGRQRGGLLEVEKIFRVKDSSPDVSL